MALSLESGLKLVCKPKGLGVEVAYTKFLEWCNRDGAALPFKVLKVCDMQTPGWVEYAPHLPCQDEEAAQRFYQRAGMLLCLQHALREVDFNKDNLIAGGEHLVLDRMETVAHPEAKPMAEFPEITEAETAVNRHFWDSVLRTGLLPRWEFSKDGLPVWKTEKISEDVEVALQTTCRHSLQGVDCVCCGNFGRLEALLAGAQKLSRPQLRDIAVQKAAWGVARAQKMGGYQFPNLPVFAFSPSFFQGTSGISYELLRLAHPDLLPSVLLWE